MVDHAGDHLVTKAPPLPLKRPARMHKLSTDKDPSYQTPPTQKMSAPGLGMGSKRLPPPQLHTDGSGGGGDGGGGNGRSTSGGSGRVVTTGPKAAALTAQGLLVSGDAKNQPTDPLSRLLQGNNNKGNGKSEEQDDGNAAAAAPAAAPLPLVPSGPGWRHTVHELPEQSQQHRNPVPRPPQQHRQRLVALVPNLRRSHRSRGGSRLVNSSGASALLTTQHRATEVTTNPTTTTTTRNAVHSSGNEDTIDPIIASPTQSPTIKLSMPVPRVILETSPTKNPKNIGGKKKTEREKKRKLNVLELGEGLVEEEKEIVEDDDLLEKCGKDGENEEIRGVATSDDEEEMYLDTIGNPRLPETRPTPLYERTQAPHGPRSRRPAVPLPLPPLSESVPATPAGLFDISETPEELRRVGAGVGGVAGVGERVPLFKRLKQNDVTGTKLALDESNRLLPGVFSPFTEQGLPVIAEEEAAAAAAVAGEQQQRQQQQEEAEEDEQHMENRNASDSLRNNRNPLRFEETEATPAAFHRHLSSAHVLATAGGGNGSGSGSRGPLSRQLRPTSKRLAALLAADMVPETSVDDINEIYGLDQLAPQEGPASARAAAAPCSTIAKKQSTAAAAPHSALPTLRPFSPRFSAPRSTGGRLQSILGRLGVGRGGGDVTPMPLQAPPSLLPGSRLTTGPRSSADVLKQTTVCPLPTAEEPLSMKLRLPLPALAVTTSVDGRFMAVLMGSHADWEPCEVLVFEISLDRQSKSGGVAAEETLNKHIPAAAKVVASISVQRSHYAAGLPITPSSFALTSTPKGDPILLLSGVFDLLDGPASLGRPTIHAVHCSIDTNNTDNNNGNNNTTTTGMGVPVTTSAAGTALGVESDEPFFSIAMLGPHTLLAVGDGSSSNGASVIEFDANWKSYSWGRSLPPAVSSVISGSGGGASGGLDDVCSLLVTPWYTLGDAGTSSKLSNTRSKTKQASISSNYLITGMSASGMVGSWSSVGGSSGGGSKAKAAGAGVSRCVAIGSHARYAVRAAIPIPHLSFTNDEDTTTTTTAVQCFVALLQSRESALGETAVAVATLTPTGGLGVGAPVPVPAPVTAIGSLAPSVFSPTTTSTAKTTITNNNNSKIAQHGRVFHHNQDKILLGCGNGTVLVWNLRTGVCSAPLDVCCGAAITSFATVMSTSSAFSAQRGELDGENLKGTEVVLCTSIDGDCLVLESAALLQLLNPS